MRGDEVVSVRGDHDDVFSRGFLCPKSQGLKQLHEDPDRLTTPLVRRDGELVEASWEEAFAAVDEGLTRVLDEGGRDAVAVYLGNPAAHSLGPTLYGTPFLKALGTKNIYSASTVDQMPKQVSAGLMFGAGLSVPIPDVDRTDHLLILGANPLVSNGSLLTAPDMRGRIRAIRERGGKVVVIDPRRSRTAQEASEHHFIRPGTDAHLLFAIAQRAARRGPRRPGTARRARRRRRADRRAWRSRSRPRRWRRSAGSTRTRSAAWPASWPRPSAPPSTRGSGPPRSASARSRAGSSTCSTTSPATSTARAGRCSRSRRRPAQLGRRRPGGQGRARRALDEPGQRPPRGLRRAAGRRPRRGDRDPGRGPGAGAGHDRRQPARLDPRRRRARGGGRDPRLHGLGRHLRQRDHPPRRRHPPRPRAAGQGPLRHRALPARRPQRRQLLAAGDRRRPRASRRSGRSCCASRRSPPARAPTPTSRPGTSS